MRDRLPVQTRKIGHWMRILNVLSSDSQQTQTAYAPALPQQEIEILSQTIPEMFSVPG
jgi:hypothetical protein